MREQFSCFYNDESDGYLKPIWEDEKTLFVFDTNVLIDLYSFQPESREDFFKVLDKLKDRIWIPYHVGLEFQRRRLDIIKKRREHFAKIYKDVDDLNNTLSFDQKKFTTLTTQLITKKNYPELFEKINKLSDSFAEKTELLKKELKVNLDRLKEGIKTYDKDKIFLNTDDHIRQKIDTYFTGDKVGNCLFSLQDEIDEFNLDGEDRFSKKIPPGYEDEVEKGESTFDFNDLVYKRKFGDLIIFKEMIQVALSKEAKNIIFVSGDKKPDWRIIEKLDGEKVLGARTELKLEINNKANVDNFYIFQIEDLLDKTERFLNVKIRQDSLTDIKKTLNENKLIVKISDENRDKNIQYFEKLRNRLYLEYRSLGVDLKEPVLTEKSLDFIVKYGHEVFDDEDVLHTLVYQDVESRLIGSKKTQTYLEKPQTLSSNSYFKESHELEKLSEMLISEKSIIVKKLNEINLIEGEENVSLLKKMALEKEKRLLKNKLNDIGQRLEKVKIDMVSIKME